MNVKYVGHKAVNKDVILRNIALSDIDIQFEYAKKELKNYMKELTYLHEARNPFAKKKG